MSAGEKALFEKSIYACTVIVGHRRTKSMRVVPATLSRDEDDMSFRLFILFFSHRLLSAFFHAEVIVEIVRADPTVRATRVRAQKCNIVLLSSAS